MRNDAITRGQVQWGACGGCLRTFLILTFIYPFQFLTSEKLRKCCVLPVNLSNSKIIPFSVIKFRVETTNNILWEKYLPTHRRIFF